MIDIQLNVSLVGLESTLDLLAEVPSQKVTSWLQQAVNRAGNQERSRSTDEIHRAVPVSSKRRIRTRIRWKPMTDGAPGRMRYMGHPRKKEGSWLRPGYMSPRIPPRREQERVGTLFGRAIGRRRRNSGVSWGIGIIGRRSEIGGFWVNVRAGRQFIQSGSPSFNKGRAVLMRRHPANPRKMQNVKGETIGWIARQIGLQPRAEARIRDGVRREFVGRLERELKAMARAPAPAST